MNCILVKHYLCGECGMDYDFKDDAKECCNTRICRECGMVKSYRYKYCPDCKIELDIVEGLSEV